MNRRPTIALQEGRTDVVTAVVIPMDGMTRLPVRTGVQVQLWNPDSHEPFPSRMVRNLSGYFVLLNEPADRLLTFRVDPTGAGYRGPLFVAFNPVAAGVSRVVALERRPDARFDTNTTLVRGSIVRTAGPGSPSVPAPVDGVVVTADPPAPTAHQFPATSDERGVFALAVGPKTTVGDDTPELIATELRFAKPGLVTRVFEVELVPGQTHVFAEPIDLDRSYRPLLEVRPSS